MKVHKEALVVSDKCLVFYIDDTGHEKLAREHPVYGLGGCAVLGRDLDRLILQPWRSVREIITGSPNTPLHAGTLHTDVDGLEEAAAIIAQFFKLPFYRFAATLSKLTALPDDMSAIRAIREVCRLRINEIVGRTLCREVKVIFEASERADPLIEEAFENLQARRGRKDIRTQCYFMPQDANDPGLEVADFVMQAVGGRTRQNLKSATAFDWITKPCSILLIKLHQLHGNRGHCARMKRSDASKPRTPRRETLGIFRALAVTSQCLPFSRTARLSALCGSVSWACARTGTHAAADRRHVAGLAPGRRFPTWPAATKSLAVITGPELADHR